MVRERQRSACHVAVATSVARTGHEHQRGAEVVTGCVVSKTLLCCQKYESHGAAIVSRCDGWCTGERVFVDRGRHGGCWSNGLELELVLVLVLWPRPNA